MVSHQLAPPRLLRSPHRRTASSTPSPSWIPPHEEDRDPHVARRGRRRPVAPQPHRRLRLTHRCISPSAPSPSRILLLAVLHVHGPGVLGLQEDIRCVHAEAAARLVAAALQQVPGAVRGPLRLIQLTIDDFVFFIVQANFHICLVPCHTCF